MASLHRILMLLLVLQIVLDNMQTVMSLGQQPLLEIAAVSWEACPPWIEQYAEEHVQAVHSWGGEPAAAGDDGGGGGMGSVPGVRRVQGVQGAMLWDCSDSKKDLGCQSGIGDRLRAIMETLKVSKIDKATALLLSQQVGALAPLRAIHRGDTRGGRARWLGMSPMSIVQRSDGETACRGARHQGID